MMPETSIAGLPPTRARSVRDRDSTVTAAVRARAYRLYSILLASPHELDVDSLLREETGLHELRPYGIDLGALCGEFLNAEMSSRKREYSGLFEVGDAGSPIAIREQQQYRDVAGILEDLVRFYDYFDYPLHPQYAWAPDHLSVILEFCHLLCHREGTASEDRLSYQLAQHDFISRHLIEWLPVFADRIDRARSGSLYAGIARSASAYLARDFAWQAGTVANEQESPS
ncbi:MAG: molecular chaperone TorD family protein [Steroidobacteraceae bacterium]